MQDMKTFALNVEGIGQFEFARRTLRSEMRINAEFSRLTEGIENPAQWFSDLSWSIAILKVLTIKHPEGWDIDAMDPLDTQTYTRIFTVYGELRAKEESFRGKPGQAGEGGGSGDGRVSGTLVQEDVPPGS